MIYPLNLVNSDGRRDLFEFGNNGQWKVCKYIDVKEDCTIGDHYHKNKDEMFLLAKGRAAVILNSLTASVRAPVVIDVKRGTKHAFVVKKGSVLICLATEEHDPSDDHKD